MQQLPCPASAFVSSTLLFTALAADWPGQAALEENPRKFSGHISSHSPWCLSTKSTLKYELPSADQLQTVIICLPLTVIRHH